MPWITFPPRDTLWKDVSKGNNEWSRSDRQVKCEEHILTSGQLVITYFALWFANIISIFRYTGSRLLLSVLPPNFILRIDQANFCLSVVISFLSGLFMRYALHPRHTAAWLRHTFAGNYQWIRIDEYTGLTSPCELSRMSLSISLAFIGVSLAVFMYGSESIHLLAQTLICWLLIKIIPARYMVKTVLLYCNSSVHYCPPLPFTIL